MAYLKEKSTQPYFQVTDWKDFCDLGTSTYVNSFNCSWLVMVTDLRFAEFKNYIELVLKYKYLKSCWKWRPNRLSFRPNRLILQPYIQNKIS